jgi:hypothetical protein
MNRSKILLEEAVVTGIACATTANITLSGTQTIDGCAVAVGDIVLVKNQSTAAQNGLYTVAVGAWSRTAGYDSGSAAFTAKKLVVNKGATNEGCVFYLDIGVYTIATTGLPFAKTSFSVAAKPNTVVFRNKAGGIDGLNPNSLTATYIVDSDQTLAN